MYEVAQSVPQKLETKVSKKKESHDRIFGLDILRCIAILTVVIGHIFYTIPNHVDRHLVRYIFFDGVNIFYTLSGFLIGSILLKQFSKEEITFSSLFKFLKNRWWRTLPAYFFVLILLTAIGIISHSHKWSEYLPYYFFLQNIKTGAIPVFGESWSLAVEEWFYLTTPLMIFITCYRLPLKKAVPVIISFVFLLANLIRVYKVHHYHINDYHQYNSDIMMTVPSRIDAVMFGVLGAYLSFYNFKIWNNYKNTFFLIGTLGFFINHYVVVITGFSFYELYFQKQVELLFVLMTLPKLSTLRGGKTRIGRAVTFISLISYSIYLVHGSVFIWFVSPLLPKDFSLQLVAYFIWAFGAAYLMYSTIEKWGLRQRTRMNARLQGLGGIKHSA